MVAPVPAQISNLPPRPLAAPLRHPLLTRPTTHYLLSAIPLRDLCAPASVISVLRFSPSSGAQASQLFCLHRTGASLSSLCALFRTRFLYFQQLAASFQKTPGWGVTQAYLASDSPTRTLFSASTQRPLRLCVILRSHFCSLGGPVPDAHRVLRRLERPDCEAPPSGNISKDSLVYQGKYLPGRTCKPRLLEGPVREGEISP